jgi:hypothetical protein
MSKHTPGPWVADLGTYPIMVGSQSETWPLVDELGNEEGRARVFIANTGDNKENASLIAAAPDLLDALSSIDVYLSDTLSGRVNPDPATYKQWLIDGIIEARNRARAAIFKATGERT